MARFSGAVGYAVGPTETSPGVYEEGIVERTYFGDVNRVSRRYEVPDSVNGVISVNHTISIVADAFALEHFFAIRYVNWAGTNWLVTTVEVNRPRLVLSIGEEYHGQTAN